MTVGCMKFRAVLYPSTESWSQASRAAGVTTWLQEIEIFLNLEKFVEF